MRWESDTAGKLSPQDWTRNLWPVWQGSSGILGCFSCLFFISGFFLCFESKSQHRFFCCSLAEQWAALRHMEENTPKTDCSVGGEGGTKVWWLWSLSLLSPVKVGAQRYAGLRYTDVIVCFDSLATACLRLLNETAFLSLGVTRCYFFPRCWVGQSLAECAERPGESECCVSRCLSLLGGWRFPAAWWQEVVGVHGLGVTAVLSDSWRCRVLQDRLCYWRQEALFPPAAWVTWQDWQPGEVLWQQLKAVPVDWYLRVKLNSSVFLWGNGI